MEMRDLDPRKTGRTTPEPGSDGFNGQLQDHHQRGARKQCHDISRHTLHKTHEYEDQEKRENAKAGFQGGKRAVVSSENFDASQKLAGNFIDLEAEKILNL